MIGSASFNKLNSKRSSYFFIIIPQPILDPEFPVGCEV